MSNSVQSSYVPRHAVNEPGHRAKVTNGLMGLAFAGGVVAVAGASTAQAAEVQGGSASHVGHQTATSSSALSNPFGLKQTQGSPFNSAQGTTHRAPLVQTKSATLPLTTASKIRHEVTQRVQADKLQRATTAKTNPDALPTVITNQAAAGGVYAVQTAGDLLAGSFSTTLDGVATIDAAVFEFGPNVAATMIEQAGTAAGQRALVQPVANVVRALGKTNTFADCVVSTTVNSAVHTGVNLVTHGGDIVNGKYSPITYVPSATCKDFHLPPKTDKPCPPKTQTPCPPKTHTPKPCPPKTNPQPCPGKVTWPKLPCPDGMHKPCPTTPKPNPCPTIPPIVVKVPCPTIPFPGNDIPCPGTETPKPGTDTPKPGTDNPKPGTDTPCPGTETPKPGTETPKPGTETPKPGTETPTPGTDSPKPGTETPKPGTETPKPGTDNPKPGNPTTPTGPIVQTDNVADDTDETVPLGSLGAAFALAAAGGVVVRRRNQN